MSYTLVLSGKYMVKDDILNLIRQQTEYPHLDSISLRMLVVDEEIGKALLTLLNLHRHRYYDTLELEDCAQTPHLEKLLRYVYHTQLFRHLSMNSTTGSLANHECECYNQDYYMSLQQQRHPKPIFTAPPTIEFHFALQTLTLYGLYMSIGNAVKLRKSLEATKQLTTLNLNFVQFERYASCQIAQGIKSNKSLRKLNGYWVSSVDACVMMHSVQMHPTLTDIHFRGECISDSTSAVLGKWLNESDNCLLQTLRLTGTSVFELVPMFSEIQSQPPLPPPRLTKLDLSDNLLKSDQVDFLFLQLHKLPSLKELNLSRNQLSNFCGALLSDPNVLSTSLTTLDMSYNRLTDHDVDEFLTHLWKFPALKDLDVSWNQLHDLDFAKFLGQERLQTYGLRQLSLTHRHFLLDDQKSTPLFSSRLLRLLKRLPRSIKIGSVWIWDSTEGQHLIDIRQVNMPSVDGEPSGVPDGLWPKMLARANNFFWGSEARQANAIFYLIQQGAPYFLSTPTSLSS